MLRKHTTVLQFPVVFIKQSVMKNISQTPKRGNAVQLKLTHLQMNRIFTQATSICREEENKNKQQQNNGICLHTATSESSTSPSFLARVAKQ